MRDNPNGSRWFVRDGRYHWTPASWQGWLLAFSPAVIVLAGAAITVAVASDGHGSRWFVRDGPHHWSPATWQGWLLTFGPAILAVIGAVLVVAVVIARYRRR